MVVGASLILVGAEGVILTRGTENLHLGATFGHAETERFRGNRAGIAPNPHGAGWARDMLLSLKQYVTADELVPARALSSRLYPALSRLIAYLRRTPDYRRRHASSRHPPQTG